MRYRERRDGTEDVEKSLAEARHGLPSPVTVLEHRGEQQGAEKEDMIKASPDVPGLSPEDRHSPSASW